MASAYSYFRFAYWLDWSGRISRNMAWNYIWFIHCGRPQGSQTKAEGYSKAVAEVCKYALKFSDLSTENTWHAFLSLKGKRLTGSFGSMHGVKIPDTATPDDKPSEELPYMEMLYRFVFGPKSYYNLEITKDVKPCTVEWGRNGAEVRRKEHNAPRTARNETL